MSNRRDLPDWLAEWMAEKDRAIKDLSGSRLSNAALDGTTLWIRDDDGSLRARLGKQDDGSYGNVTIRVPPPPQLTAPILMPGHIPGAVGVRWDGETFDSLPMPRVHGHTEVWAEQVDLDNWVSTVAPSEAGARVGSIRDRTGGDTTVVLTRPGTWAVWLRAMGADRETAGPWSPYSTVEVHAAVDTEAIEEILEEERKRVDAAVEQLSGGQAELDGKLSDLDAKQDQLESSVTQTVTSIRDDLQDFRTEWEDNWDPEAMESLRERQDGLEQDLSTGLDNVYDRAEKRAEELAGGAVVQAAQNAQAEYDRIAQRQDASDEEIEAARQAAEAARQEAINAGQEAALARGEAAQLQERSDQLQELAERALETAVTQAGNLYPDPSFEHDGAGLTTNSRWEILETHIARHGDHVMRFTGNGGTGPAGAMSQALVWEPSNRAYISVWVMRTDTAQTGDLQVRVRRHREDAGSLYTTVIRITLDDMPLNVWTKFEGQYSNSNDDTSGLHMFFQQAAGVNLTGVLVDNVLLADITQAHAALQAAEDALRRANEAHERAGTALENAARAQEAASGKSTVHFSLTAPTGVGVEGDVWWRYERDTASAPRRITGQWFWEDGAWRASEMDEEFLPMVNIGTGTYGDLHGERLTASTVQAGALAVIPDAADYAPGPGGFEDLWTQGSGAGFGDSQYDPTGRFIRVTPDGPAPSRSYGPWIPTQPGDKIRYRFYVATSGDPDFTLRFYFLRDGSVTSWSRVQNITQSGWYEGVYEAPASTESSIAFGVTANANGGTQGHYQVRNLDVRQQVKGVQIENGAIKAHHADFVDMTASDAFLDNAMVNLIQGRMANFDQAIIGGSLLKNNSIATKHVVITNTDNLFDENWLDDIGDTDYVYWPGGGSGSGNAAARFAAENPSSAHPDNNGASAWMVSTVQGLAGISYRPSKAGGTNQRIAFRLGPAKGIMVRPGDQFTFRAVIRDMTNNGFLNVDMHLFDVETGTGVGTTAVPRFAAQGIVNSGPDDETVWNFVIPNDYPKMWMVPTFNGSPTGSSTSWRSILRPSLHRAQDGRLTVDGTIESRAVNTEEFFAAEAVISKIWTEIVRSRLVESQGIITEDMIATGAITTPKITVTDEMVAEVVRLMRLEGDEMIFNRIVGMVIEAADIQGSVFRAVSHDGEETVRLDGTSNYVRGAISAGVSDQAEVQIDYKTITITSGWEDEDSPGEIYEQDDAPVIQFIRDDVQGTPVIRPTIWADDTGMLRISPGRTTTTPQHRGQVKIHGDATANRFNANRFLVDTDSVAQSGGLRKQGARTRLHGRLPDNNFSIDMFSTGIIGPIAVSTGQFRGTLTWSSPPPNGVRRAMLTTVLPENARQGWDSAYAAAAGISSSGFNWIIKADWSGYTWNVWLPYNAFWQ